MTWIVNVSTNYLYKFISILLSNSLSDEIHGFLKRQGKQTIPNVPIVEIMADIQAC